MSEVESGSKKGSRQTNMDLNLVPFIDLMSVLISFLLITAVWTQVSMIQIGSSLYGKKIETQPPAEPPPHADVVLKLEVRPTGYVLTIGKQSISLPMKGAAFDDAGLTAQLQRVKQLYPDKFDAVVAVADALKYEQLIHAMDTLLVTGFSAISVATGGP